MWRQVVGRTCVCFEPSVHVRQCVSEDISSRVGLERTVDRVVDWISVWLSILLLDGGRCNCERLNYLDESELVAGLFRWRSTCVGGFDTPVWAPRLILEKAQEPHPYKWRQTGAPLDLALRMLDKRPTSLQLLNWYIR
jgi:hypothetical protein